MVAIVEGSNNMKYKSYLKDGEYVKGTGVHLRPNSEVNEQFKFGTIEAALEEFKKGEMLIVLDDEVLLL